MKIFCLIPAFNETGNLKELTDRLVSIFQTQAIDYKIFFVLQGNTDGLFLIEKIKKRNVHIDYVYYPQPLGIGKAYQIGFQFVTSIYTHVLTLDADLNHQPEELIKFFKRWQEKHPHIIVGSRFMEGGNFADRRIWKRFISLLVNSISTKLLRTSIRDITSGFRLITSQVIIEIRSNLKENGYPAYMEFMLLSVKKGFKVDEVPIHYIPRKWGKSKMGKVPTLFHYLLFFTRTIFRF